METALVNLVAGQTTALYVGHITQQSADAFQCSDGLRRVACVVTPLHHRVVGVGAHDDELRAESGERVKGQDAVVLQQHNTLAGHVEGQLFMFIRGHDTFRNLRPRHEVVTVEVAHLEAGDEQTTQ